MGRDPGEIYRDLTRDLGEPVYERIDASATPEQKATLERLSPSDIHTTELGGEPIEQILSTAPGDGYPIGGIKVIAKNGWFAARPSGTEEIYKIYAESFLRRKVEPALSSPAKPNLPASRRSTNHLKPTGTS
jgi:phosphoglucomutase